MIKSKIKILTTVSLLTLSSFSYGDYVVKFSNSQTKGMIPETVAQTVFSSCKEILDTGNSDGDGVYTIGVNNKEFDVYCDMTSAGGGWTMVVAQFEEDSVTNWNEGVQVDYDPSLFTSKGFALNSQEMPSHSQTAFGKQFEATFVGFSNFNYTSGNIPKTLLNNLKTNESFHIYRNLNNFHSYGDPEDVLDQNPDWNNQLTYDKLGGRMYNWTFYPNTLTAEMKGFNLGGINVMNSKESFAWTVWVR